MMVVMRRTTLSAERPQLPARRDMEGKLGKRGEGGGGSRDWGDWREGKAPRDGMKAFAFLFFLAELQFF